MTRYAILSDIHGNLEAFEKVLQHADEQKAEEILFLGDLVVYGPDPNACVKRLREVVGADGWSNQVVLGNNDKAVLGGDEDMTPAHYLRSQGNVDGEVQLYRTATNESLTRTREVLDDESRELLMKLRDGEGRRDILTHTILVHASPCDSTGMDGNYLTTDLDAEEAFYELETQLRKRYCFFGHTHLATLFERYRDDRPYRNSRIVRADELIDKTIALTDNPMLINPGSVGQPRDGDNRASYAILDADKMVVTFYRVHYARDETVRKLQQSGLSASVTEILVRRLREAR